MSIVITICLLLVFMVLTIWGGGAYIMQWYDHRTNSNEDLRRECREVMQEVARQRAGMEPRRRRL